MTRDEGDAAGEDPAEQRGPLDERPAADALRAPVRERPAHFLLERLEEPGRDDEDERPEAVQRGVAGVGELARGEDLEAVRREPDDDESSTDGVGAFGERSVLGGLDEPLLTRLPLPGGPRLVELGDTTTGSAAALTQRAAGPGGSGCGQYRAGR